MKNTERTALVFGASGMVGNYLVRQLLENPAYSKVDIFVRNPAGHFHPKLREHQVDFGRLGDYAELIKGDDLFVCLGSTIRKAGSVARFGEIDRDLPVKIARMAHENGVGGIAVISSLGADSSSRNYYLRIKGEMEAGVQNIPFDRIVIARPSMLFGTRKSFRLGESVGKIFMKAIGFLLVGQARKYRGIDGRTVAAAMISLIQLPGRKIYQSDELQESGKRQL
jgi:uncharacterized protein YbjT (DUF2867 family)